MGKNSKKKDVKKSSKTSPYKSIRAFKKSVRKSKRSVHAKQEESLSSSASSVDQCLGTASSCYSLLNDMCVHAALFQRHSHRDKLFASDVQKASDLYVLKKQLNIINEKKKNIELSSCIEKTIDVKEAEKTFYYGKCLNSPKLTDITDIDTDQCLKDYFEFTMQAVLVDNSELFSLLLSDLKKNPSILSILPVFIHNLCRDGFLLKHKPAHLKKFLLVIHSLYLNPNLYFQNEYLYKMLDFIIACAITKPKSEEYQPDDIFSLQDTSAEIFHDIFIKNHSLSSQVYSYVLTKLALPFKETIYELMSCCGSLAVVNVMGLTAIAFILSLIFPTSPAEDQGILNNLIGVLNSKDKSYAKVIKTKLFDACQNFVEYSLYKALALPDVCEQYKVEEPNKHKISKSKTNAPHLNVELCCSILKYYGKALNSCLPLLLNTSNKVVPVSKLFEMLEQKIFEKDN